MLYTDDGESRDRMPPTEGSLVEPEIDKRFRLLASEERRYLLGCLIATDEWVSIDTLVEHIAARTGESRERVYTQLHHCHFPRLRTAGLVEFDPESRRLTYTGGQWTKTLLEVSERAGDRTYLQPVPSEDG